MRSASGNGAAGAVSYVVEFGGERCEAVVRDDGIVILDGEPRRVSLARSEEGSRLSLLLDDVPHTLHATPAGRGRWSVDAAGRPIAVRVLDPLEARARDLAGADRGSMGVAPLVAPMPGLVVSVAARPGAVVAPGDALLAVEAMKMENRLSAAAAARVTRVLVAPGDAVAKGQTLVEFEPLESE